MRKRSFKAERLRVGLPFSAQSDADLEALKRKLESELRRRSSVGKSPKLTSAKKAPRNPSPQRKAELRFRHQRAGPPRKKTKAEKPLRPTPARVEESREEESEESGKDADHRDTEAEEVVAEDIRPETEKDVETSGGEEEEKEPDDAIQTPEHSGSSSQETSTSPKESPKSTRKTRSQSSGGPMAADQTWLNGLVKDIQQRRRHSLIKMAVEDEEDDEMENEDKEEEEEGPLAMDDGAPPSSCVSQRSEGSGSDVSPLLPLSPAPFSAAIQVEIKADSTPTLPRSGSLDAAESDHIEDSGTDEEKMNDNGSSDDSVDEEETKKKNKKKRKSDYGSGGHRLTTSQQRKFQDLKITLLVQALDGFKFRKRDTYFARFKEALTKAQRKRQQTKATRLEDFTTPVYSAGEPVSGNDADDGNWE